MILLNAYQSLNFAVNIHSRSNVCLNLKTSPLRNRVNSFNIDEKNSLETPYILKKHAKSEYDIYTALKYMLAEIFLNPEWKNAKPFLKISWFWGPVALSGGAKLKVCKRSVVNVKLCNMRDES